MITHVQGNRSPSLTDTITVNGEPFDLTGLSVQFQMRADDSDELKTDAAANITNMPGEDGAVYYDWAAGDVDTAGRFIGWFRVNLGGGVFQDTPEFLITFYSHAPGARDLCTLEDIQSYIPGYVAFSDLATDSILMEMITATSQEIHNATRREIMPAHPNPYSKTFDVSDFDAAEGRLFVGALADLDGLEVNGVAAPDVKGRPANRQPWEPINYLKNFPDALAAGDEVEITGNWGFPEVPDDVRMACVKLVINRYLRDVAVGGTAFADAVTDADYSLSTAFASAQDTIHSYTYLVIA